MIVITDPTSPLFTQVHARLGGETACGLAAPPHSPEPIAARLDDFLRLSPAGLCSECVEALAKAAVALTVIGDAIGEALG